MKRHLAATAIAGAIVLVSPAIDSCSFVDPVVFHLERRPDGPPERFAAGRLGLLLPTFAQSHLIVAYRYLDGTPLSVDEQQGATALVNRRLAETLQTWTPDEPPPAMTVADQWLAARTTAVPDAPPAQVKQERLGHDRNYYVNCTDDAFVTAIATLGARVRSFGAGSAPVRSWLDAQDAVFAACPGLTTTVPPAEPGLPPIIVKDRAYQTAAAAFYAGDYAGAHDLFAAIGEDHDSPWSNLGAYCAIRCLLREATVNSEGEELSYPFDKELLQQAQDELHPLLTEPRFAPMRPAIVRLADFIRFRLDPAADLAERARRLTRGSDQMDHDLGDYTLLLDRDVAAADDLTEWVRTMHLPFDPAQDPATAAPADTTERYARAVEHWRKSHRTPWLVAALVFAQPASDGVATLLDDAAKVPDASPAYLTLAWHRMRLLRSLGRDDERDALLAHVATLAAPPSYVNLIRALQLPMAGTIADVDAALPRFVVGRASQNAEPGNVQLIEDDGAAMLNQRTPLSVLLQLAVTPREALRRQYVIAAWTRAAILGRDDVALALDSYLAECDPALQRPLERYRNASPARRWIELTDILAHFPGLSPYVLAGESRVPVQSGAAVPLSEVPHDQYTHENWWCTAGIQFYQAMSPKADDLVQPVTPPALQPAAIRKEVDEEQAALARAGAGATFVLRNAVRWAKATPDDPRVPEALAEAIATTQWACPDANTRDAAATAFKLLKSKYPTTDAAKRTRYWYDGGW